MINKKQKLKLKEIIDRIKRYGDRFKNAGDVEGMVFTSLTIKDIKKCKKFKKAKEIEDQFKEKVKLDQMSKLIVEFIDGNGKVKKNLNNLILYIFFQNDGSELDIRDLKEEIIKLDKSQYLDLPLFQIFIVMISLDTLGLIIIDDKKKHYSNQKYRLNKPGFQKYLNANWEEYHSLLHETYAAV